MSASYLVTGGGGGIGRAVVVRLARTSDFVVAMDTSAAELAWIDTHPASDRIIRVVGDASDERVTEDAADRAEAVARGQ